MSICLCFRSCGVAHPSLILLFAAHTSALGAEHGAVTGQRSYMPVLCCVCQHSLTTLMHCAFHRLFVPRSAQSDATTKTSRLGHCDEHRQALKHMISHNYSILSEVKRGEG
jgi:hypothetical protein